MYSDERLSSLNRFACTKQDTSIDNLKKTFTFISSDVLIIGFEMLNTRIMSALTCAESKASQFRGWLQLRFGCNSTAPRPFDDLRYDRAAALRHK